MAQGDIEIGKTPTLDFGLDSPAPTTSINYNPRQKQKSFNPFGLMKGRNVQYAQEDYQRQLDLMDKIAEMSAGYSSDNTLGTTDIDYENKMITEKLSPELQAEYDALLARSKLQRERAAAMGDDPYALQMYLYNQNADLRAGEADNLRNKLVKISKIVKNLKNLK